MCSNCGTRALSHSLQRVVETQHKKRELAELLLSPDGHAGLEKGIDKIKVRRTSPLQYKKLTAVTVFPIAAEISSNTLI